MLSPSQPGPRSRSDQGAEGGVFNQRELSRSSQPSEGGVPERCDTSFTSTTSNNNNNNNNNLSNNNNNTSGRQLAAHRYGEGRKGTPEDQHKEDETPKRDFEKEQPRENICDRLYEASLLNQRDARPHDQRSSEDLAALDAKQAELLSRFASEVSQRPRSIPERGDSGSWYQHQLLLQHQAHLRQSPVGPSLVRGSSSSGLRSRSPQPAVSSPLPATWHTPESKKRVGSSPSPTDTSPPSFLPYHHPGGAGSGRPVPGHSGSQSQHQPLHLPFSKYPGDLAGLELHQRELLQKAFLQSIEHNRGASSYLLDSSLRRLSTEPAFPGADWPPGSQRGHHPPPSLPPSHLHHLHQHSHSSGRLPSLPGFPHHQNLPFRFGGGQEFGLSTSGSRGASSIPLLSGGLPPGSLLPPSLSLGGMTGGSGYYPSMFDRYPQLAYHSSSSAAAGSGRLSRGGGASASSSGPSRSPDSSAAASFPAAQHPRDYRDEGALLSSAQDQAARGGDVAGQKRKRSTSPTNTHPKAVRHHHHQQQEASSSHDRSPPTTSPTNLSLKARILSRSPDFVNLSAAAAATHPTGPQLDSSLSSYPSQGRGRQSDSPHDAVAQESYQREEPASSRARSVREEGSEPAGVGHLLVADSVLVPALHSPIMSVGQNITSRPDDRLLPHTRQPGNPAHFTKGSLIQLANGMVKKVEDLVTADFLESAESSPDVRIDRSTVVKLEERRPRGSSTASPCPPTSVFLTFSVGKGRVQVTVEAAPEHPFFVFDLGWTSCCPELTLARYQLACKQLRIGDVCISLTHKAADPQPSPASPSSLSSVKVASGSPGPSHWSGTPPPPPPSSTSPSVLMPPPPLTPVSMTGLSSGGSSSRDSPITAGASESTVGGRPGGHHQKSTKQVAFHDQPSIYRINTDSPPNVREPQDLREPSQSALTAGGTGRPVPREDRDPRAAGEATDRPCSSPGSSSASNPVARKDEKARLNQESFTKTPSPGQYWKGNVGSEDPSGSSKQSDAGLQNPNDDKKQVAEAMETEGQSRLASSTSEHQLLSQDNKKGGGRRKRKGEGDSFSPEQEGDNVIPTRS